MQLTIKGPGGKVLQVDVDDGATVLDLKRAIEQAHPEICPSSIRLIFSGKILADANTLQFYSIQSGQPVHMVVTRPQARPPPQPTQDAMSAPRSDPAPAGAAYE